MTPIQPRKWRLARIGSTDVLVRPSLLMMAVVLVIVFAPQFNSFGYANGYVVAGVFVLALYISILLHEFAHLFVARRYKMVVPAIELHLMGGETQIEGRSSTATQEFLTSSVGPLVSLIIGIAALVAATGTNPWFATILWPLGFINIIVAVFNVLPSPPLDGGRMVKAVAWGLSRSELIGVRVAGLCGRVTAVVIAVGGPLLIGFGFSDPFDVARIALVLFVAWYLWESSSKSLIHGVRAARTATLDAASLYDPAVPPAGAAVISIKLKGRDLLIAMAENPAEVYALMDDEGRIIGSLHAGDVDRAYREAT